jgi:Ca2+-binding RTX toxin-like protein
VQIDSNGGALVGHIDGLRLVKSGQYTVQVSDNSSSGNATGPYELFYVKAPGANANGVLPNGQKIGSEIELGDLDSYTFSANAGDMVYLRVADTETTEFINSNFTPFVALFDPDGDLVDTDWGALVAHLDGVDLVKTGTYTVVVRDNSSGDDSHGSYDIYFVKAPGANDDGELPNGEKISSQIDLGDLDTYTFIADAGDTVYIRVSDKETTEFINSNFTPFVALVDPDGDLVDSDWGALVGHIDGQSLVKTGVYTVIVRDNSSGDDNIGSYDIYYLNAPGANSNGELPNGGRVSSNIELGDLDSYTFTANAGDTVYLRVSDTETTEFISSNFTPFIALFDPDGDLVDSDWGALVGHIDGQALSKSGTYTVVVRDNSSGDDNIGDYDVYYAKAPGASDDGCIANNQGRDGYIELGDLDSYTFDASAGINTVITITDLDVSSFTPHIALFDAGGTLIDSDWDSLTAEIDINLTNGGTFTIIVRDNSSGDDNVGNYRLEINGVGINCPVVTCNGLPVTVFIGSGGTPTSGDDVILGTHGPDTIAAMGGNDTICALAGDDDINGGRGDDWIDAGSGDDIVQGANDDDEIYGDSGMDTLFGGPGNDMIFGEQGDDFIKGNSDNDTLDGGDGVDRISGGSGNDTIYTGSGSNVGTSQTVTGGNGDDTIYGDVAADEIRGEAGDDTIRGRAGNDRLFGGAGEDDINGEAGHDLVRGNAADDILRGGDGNDQIDGLGGKDLMYGGNGGDMLTGSTGNDVMFGQTGNDELNGGGGNDSLDGGGGVDDCNGAGGSGDISSACESQSNIP